VFEIEVSAPGAMRETREGNCNPPCVKPVIARMASPGLQFGYRKRVIQRSVAVGTKTVCATTLRAYHLLVGSRAHGPEEYRKTSGRDKREDCSSNRHSSVEYPAKGIAMPSYTDAHSRAGIDAKLPKLETWPNHFPGYEITTRYPEYTSVCPKTSLPDFGTITIYYEPNRACLELKALKLYLLAYRDLGIFYENAVNRMLRDIVAAAHPKWCRVTGEFTPRGGLTTTVEAHWPRGRHGSSQRRG
jgi:7-cyano-7-deazaguanine reductase